MGGCVSTKGELADRHPNVFHVWNVDELGNLLVPGQIEITDTELVLYQKGKESIHWPMRCLRRYGFDAELFSFESGRRCATGPGIYAFKCRRAEALFNLLQECIQNSGYVADVSNVIPPTGTAAITANGGGGSGAVMPNGSLIRSGGGVMSDSDHYLEPIVRHRTRSNASRDGFTSRLATHSLPSNLAFAGAASPTNGGHHYVNDDLSTAERERSSGSVSLRSPLTPPANLPLVHEYANAAVNEAGEPVLLDSTEEEQSLASENATVAIGADRKVLYSILDLPKNVAGAVKGANGCRQVVFRGHSLDDNTNYARLDDLLKQEQHTAAAQYHLYMNVTPANGASHYKKRDSNGSGGGIFYRDHFYANVEPRQKSMDGATFAAATAAADIVASQLQAPAVVAQVNYAILDLNQHRGSNGSSAGSVATGGAATLCDTAPTSPTSLAPDFPCRSSLEGYATIDFDRTAALSNSANPCLDDDESVRKTRHNGNISDLLQNKLEA